MTKIWVWVVVVVVVLVGAYFLFSGNSNVEPVNDTVDNTDVPADVNTAEDLNVDVANDINTITDVAGDNGAAQDNTDTGTAQ